MKFEIKTEKDYFSKPYLSVLITISIFFQIILVSDISLKLRKISRYYEIDYLCKLLKVEKSKSDFQSLFKLSKLKDKQNVLDLCRGMVN